MKVSEIKKLLNAVPHGITQEDFDNLDVVISLDGEEYIDADIRSSGVSIITNFQGQEEMLFSIQSADPLVILGTEQLN